MMALPGWKHCAHEHHRLLDSEIWSKYVFQFAKDHDFQFTKDNYDLYHERRAGHSPASHVEPKLMLWFACYILTKRMKQKFNLKHIYLLRKLKTKIEAEIIISEAACPSCQKFRELIEVCTGIEFTFKVCKNLGMLKPYKDSHGRKRYPRLASEESESAKGAEIEEDNKQHPYPLQPPSPNIMVIVKSQIQSRSEISKLKQPRKRRQYDDDSDMKITRSLDAAERC
jgi:hypothetical protein